MTRWAFVSDIHGNRGALERAATTLTAAGADAFICLGDVIGRGDPEGCVAWVRDHATIAIVGNRDLDYLDRVSPDLQAVVRSWPNEGAASDFIVSHGDPKLHRTLNSRAEHDGFAHVWSYLASHQARLWCFGHTHRARAWAIGSDGVHPVVDPALTMAPDVLYAVNVGTTGLPLPGRGGPSCLLYDDAEGTITTFSLQARTDNVRAGGN